MMYDSRVDVEARELQHTNKLSGRTTPNGQPTFFIILFYFFIISFIYLFIFALNQKVIVQQFRPKCLIAFVFIRGCV